jgi:hypothetical protein
MNCRRSRTLIASVPAGGMLLVVGLRRKRASSSPAWPVSNAELRYFPDEIAGTADDS